MLRSCPRRPAAFGPSDTGHLTRLPTSCRQDASAQPNIPEHRQHRARAVGVDIWKAGDQSGNSLAVARRNAELEGVSERVQLETADLRDLPFAEASFDAVLSSLALHNIHAAAERRRALGKAVQVLRPGGRLLLADILHVKEYRRELERLGLKELAVRELGPGTWFGNPFVRMRLVFGIKPLRR